MARKVLIINSMRNYGAVGTIAENIALAAIGHGYTVEVAHGLKYTRPSQVPSMAFGNRRCEAWHHFRSLTDDGHGLGSTTDTLRLITHIKQTKPHLIHIHNLHGYYVNYPLLFGFLVEYGAPVVWTMHDFWPLTGHCAHFAANGCSGWTTECKHCRHTDAYPRSIVDRAARNFELKRKTFTALENLTIVAVSDWQAGIIRQSFMSRYPIVRIYNGVDTGVFTPRETDLRRQLNLDGKRVFVAAAAPWQKTKGWPDYLELSRRLPDNCRLVLVGVSRRQKHRLHANVVGVGHIDNPADMARYYSMADVALNLSYQETFGMTTAEALSCGTPAVVYNATASPELISPVTGIAVTPGDIDAVLTAATQLDKKLMAETCRRHAVENFALTKQTLQYIELYNRLS